MKLETKPCQHPGCAQLGFACELDADDPAPAFYCSAHAFSHGYCCLCGMFWAGVGSFEFGNGLCEHCRDEVETDDGDSELEWDECFDEFDEMDLEERYLD